MIKPKHPKKKLTDKFEIFQVRERYVPLKIGEEVSTVFFPAERLPNQKKNKKNANRVQVSIISYDDGGIEFRWPESSRSTSKRKK